jgi:hypothetical protein
MKKKKKKKKNNTLWPPVGDMTSEIARSRAISRVRGPFKVTCTACGEHYWPDKKEEHLSRCTPPEVHVSKAIHECPYCHVRKANLEAHIHAKHQDRKTKTAQGLVKLAEHL